jgi:hypothetical protein
MNERVFEGEAGAPAERVVALPMEGATGYPRAGVPVIAEKDWDKGLRVYSDDDDERNRFLTLAMGECWHSFELGCPVYTCKGGGFICGLCRDFVVANNDFATEEDFSKLWSWIQTVPELREWASESGEALLLSDHAGRRAFADRVYEFLRRHQP